MTKASLVKYMYFLMNETHVKSKFNYHKHLGISHTFFLKFWAKNRGCGLYTRQLVSEGVKGLWGHKLNWKPSVNKNFNLKPFANHYFQTFSRSDGSLRSHLCGSSGSKPESCSPVVLSSVSLAVCSKNTAFIFPEIFFIQHFY